MRLERVPLFVTLPVSEAALELTEVEYSPTWAGHYTQ